MAKKDGTILEIKITMKQDEFDSSQINTSINKTYCDKDFKNPSAVFMLAVAAAIKEAGKRMNKDAEND